MAKHPVPKKRTSASRRDQRRAHDALKPPQLVDCPQCGSKKPGHVVCPECGYYKDRQVLPEA